jgi:hypothetical protein
MASYAIARFAGRKCKWAHIPVRTGDLSSPVGSPQYQLCYQWGTGHVSDPWNNFIKPCIDAAVLQDCNGVGFTFDCTLLAGDTIPHLTELQCQTIMAQLANYCATNHLMLYVRLSFGASVQEAHNTYHASVADIQSWFTFAVTPRSF